MAEDFGGTMTLFLETAANGIDFQPAAPLSAAQLLTFMNKFDAMQYSLTCYHV
jgi:hypothetical protein